MRRATRRRRLLAAAAITAALMVPSPAVVATLRATGTVPGTAIHLDHDGRRILDDADELQDGDTDDTRDAPRPDIADVVARA